MCLPLETYGSLSPTSQQPCMDLTPSIDTSHSAGGNPGSRHRQDCIGDTGTRIWHNFNAALMIWTKNLMYPLLLELGTVCNLCTCNLQLLWSWCYTNQSCSLHDRNVIHDHRFADFVPGTPWIQILWKRTRWSGLATCKQMFVCTTTSWSCISLCTIEEFRTIVG